MAIRVQDLETRTTLNDEEYLHGFDEDSDFKISKPNAFNGLVKQSDITNNLSSSSTTNPLSANMGRELSDRIDNLSELGKFLSMWNCVTGLAKTNPPSSPYEYHTGDYFIITEVGATNYMPNGTQYVTGQASTTTYSGDVMVGDIWYYDGTNWSLAQTRQNKITYGTTDLTPNVSPLATGTFYFVYEE